MSPLACLFDALIFVVVGCVFAAFVGFSVEDPRLEMTNRAIVTSIVLSIVLGLTIAAAFTWLVGTDEPEQADAPAAVSTQ